MSGRFNDMGRLPNAGYYSRAELMALHDQLTGMYQHDGFSGAVALRLAEAHLFNATGQTLKGPYGPGSNDHSQKRRPSRRYTEAPTHESDFERGFYDNNSRDRSRGGSTPILSLEEIKTRASAIENDLLDKGANEDYARQQAEMYFFRQRGLRNAAEQANRPSQSSRPSAYGNDGGYSSRSSGSSRHGSSRRYGPGPGAPRGPGWEGPEFDQYFTEEPDSPYGPSRSQSYYEDCSGRLRDGTSSRSGGYDSAYDGKLPRSSRDGPRGYRTEEERHPGGDFSSSNFNGYGNSGTPPPDDDNWLPSGVKPAEDLYKVLGIAPTATMDAIKQAHRKMSITNHPDREKGGMAAKKVATERMARINQAYDVLRDAEMRYYYDKTGTIVSKFDQP